MKRIRTTLMIGVFAAIIFSVSSPALAAKCYVYNPAMGPVCVGEPSEPMFVEPVEPENSLLPYQTYARLNDNINVYSGPSLGAPIVRNVGDGYLFSTVEGTVENEGRTWYIINPGEYVKAEDVRLHADSEFAGYEIHEQPERPFGWMLVDFAPSRTPGMAPLESTPKLHRYDFFQVYDAFTADDGWIWYNIGGGWWIRQTYVSIVDPNPRPEGVGENEYWVEIDLYEQSFAAYEGDRMVYAGLVSSGLNRWPTNEGLFQVWDRWRKTKMSGAEGKVDYYFIEDVPYTMFFDNDIALHGAFWHDRFGYKHSHGCVNMPPRDAEWVFNWSENAPHDLWVWVHTSNPNHYFERYDPQGSFPTPY